MAKNADSHRTGLAPAVVHGSLFAVDPLWLVLGFLGIVWASASIPALAQDVTAEPAVSQEAQIEPVGFSLALTTTRIRQHSEEQETIISLLGLSYDLSPRSAFFLNLGHVYNDPTLQDNADGFANPSLGVTLDLKPNDRTDLKFLLGISLPFGSASGNDPNPATISAMLSATDWGGPMFAPNHMDIFPGFRVGYSGSRFGFRFRSTLHYVRRVDGDEIDPLGRKIIFTSSGLLANASLGDRTTVFAELAQTYYLNNPPFVVADTTARDDYYMVVGVSFELPLDNSRSLEPTLLYAESVDDPKMSRGFHLIELALRYSF